MHLQKNCLNTFWHLNSGVSLQLPYSDACHVEVHSPFCDDQWKTCEPLLYTLYVKQQQTKDLQGLTKHIREQWVILSCQRVLNGLHNPQT